MGLITSEIERLESQFLQSNGFSLEKASLEEKLQTILSSDVEKFLAANRYVSDVYESCDTLGKVVIGSLITLGQAQNLFHDPDQLQNGWNKWYRLLEMLKDFELFYAPIGGIIGYHLASLRALCLQLGEQKSHKLEKVSYSKPPRIDIREESDQVQRAIRTALENWSKIALIMPVGGAGDRLGLQDSQGVALPAAFLEFEGSNLLEGIFKDIEAIETLVFQVTGEKVFTPVALMTSDEKDNHRLLEKYIAEKNYFGRPIDTIRLFCQKRVPVITEEGNWALEGPLEPVLKPGGHGVLWRGAFVAGIIDYFEKIGREFALVRQINNPLASTDYNLLALAGFAIDSQKSIGFLSCERLVHSSEGMNVARVREVGERRYCCITNVEYTDFIQEGIEDAPESENSHYSAYGSNTNIFAVKLSAIKEALTRRAFPGLILNLKTKSSVREGHEIKLVRVGRLESMMQNIADHLEVEDEAYENLDQFLLFGLRSKVISVAKIKAPEIGFANETAPSAFFDKQMMWRHLLSSKCQVHMPLAVSMEEYFQKIPPFMLRLSPCLGPLHRVIAKRIKSGTLARGSFLDLDLTHLFMSNFYIDGALRIYSKPRSLAVAWLHQVTIVNGSWMNQPLKEIWKGKELPGSSLDIEFEGDGLFIAKQVSFEGVRKIIVPHGKIIEAAYNEFGELILKESIFSTQFPPALEKMQESIRLL